MSLIEITQKVNQIASVWEQFKVANERRLTEIEKRQAADPLTLNQLEKLNSVIQSYEEKMQKAEVSSQRPGLEFKASSSLEDKEHKSAFNTYLRTGDELGLRNLNKKTLSTISDTDGGFFITRGGIDMVVAGIEEYSPMRGLASVTTISGDALEVIEDFDDAYAGWTQETESRGETKTPTLNKKIIQVHEMYAQPKATQKLIDDSSIDTEEWLAGKLIDAFMRMENSSFITGDGAGKPKGILSYANGIGASSIEQIASGEKGIITPASLIKLYYSLKENFAVKGKFLMSRAAVQACRMLKDPTSGQYLWQQSLESSNPSRIFGCEVVQSADMPAPKEGSLSIAFGDFAAGYQIVDRQGISILRDPFTDKPFVKFYATKRVGGGVLNGNAIKILKLSA
ncbi:MAG: phage major capsid protein [Candidatus Jidaibacter sp.]|jgi:HK97 family phage major capsid protein|nr:phage major capsid protein [Candidatus Jidaibacter sp.]